MLTKAVGVPIPIPGDVVMLATAARVAQGKLVLWQAFGALLVALVLGGLVQFALARGPARSFVYHFGRYLGLTSARLDNATAKLQRGNPLTIGLAILTPGIRVVTVAACGLASLPLRVFVPGLLLGSTLFLSLHFMLGYAGGTLLEAVPLPLVVGLVVAGFGVWYILRRWQRPNATRKEIVAEALEAWHEATCPVCLALGATSRITPALMADPVK